MIDQSAQELAVRMGETVQRYFDGCNAADIELMCNNMTDDAVHYFPPGMYGGPFRGARDIAEKWAAAVHSLGSKWTIDRLAVDVDRAAVVVEWTHFKTAADVVLRGIEWHDLTEDGTKIREIRAYYASPQAGDLTRLELAGFDYAGRDYAQAPA